MYYVLSEEEMKSYRLCRAKIINTYNNRIKKYKDNNKAEEIKQDKMIQEFGEILGVENIGIEYRGT